MTEIVSTPVVLIFGGLATLNASSSSSPYYPIFLNQESGE